MKRALSPTLWACCVLFGLSLSVVAASSATAALPELGRCVPAEETMEGKKTVHHGAFSNHGCTKVNATHTGKYEWLPRSRARRENVHRAPRGTGIRNQRRDSCRMRVRTR